MKKGLATILFLFYFAFSSGVVINLHYCMNRFDSSKFGANKSDICDRCGMHKDAANGCCHDEVKLIKIQDDQKTSGVNFTFTAPQTLINHNLFFALISLRDSQKEFADINHSPPLSKQDTYLQNCVFRI